jgi:hypothetical protein
MHECCRGLPVWIRLVENLALKNCLDDSGRAGTFEIS